MRIPIYEEITLDNHEKEIMMDILKTKEFGQVPYYISIITIKDELIEEAIKNISEALITLNIEPNFPYPVYVVCPKEIHHPTLNILDSVNSLPRHFFNKARRLKTKESALLSKTSLIASKIKNENISEKMSDLDKIVHPQRKLYEVTKEIYFYETILKGMEGNQED